MSHSKWWFFYSFPVKANSTTLIVFPDNQLCSWVWRCFTVSTETDWRDKSAVSSEYLHSADDAEMVVSNIVCVCVCVCGVCVF